MNRSVHLTAKQTYRVQIKFFVVGILEYAKCILQIHIFRADVKKKKKDSDFGL